MSTPDVKPPFAWRIKDKDGQWLLSSANPSKFFDVSDSLALHSDYVAERARADKAEAQVADLTAKLETAEAIAGGEITEEAWRNHAEIDRLTAKLDEARGVLREVLDVLPYCPTCEAGGTLPHEPWCRLAAAIAPETVKEK